MVAFADGSKTAPEVMQVANVRDFDMFLENVFFNIKGLFYCECVNKST
jgi:hypothetical protein